MNRFTSLSLLAACVSFVTFDGIHAAPLEIRHDEKEGKLTVHRQDRELAILTQHARPDFRPYLHPIIAPDGKGILTESSPSHHRHQTGIYWGFTRVNERDFFHHPEGDYWRRVSATILKAKSQGVHGPVQWQTCYQLLGEDGQAILTETQIWTMREDDSGFTLDLHWSGEAHIDVTLGKYDYGGLFVRMPWRKGMDAEVLNAARQRNLHAEGKRAPWIDLGMQVEGRQTRAHIAIFDHPKNPRFPQPWRVDGQFGVGPAPTRLGDWAIAKGERVDIRHQLRIYAGELNDLELTKAWSDFSGEPHTWALWRLAQQEGRSAEFLTPEKAVAAMTVKDGFQANVWAAEPLLTQPMAFCWDDRGRLWIAENRDYENRRAGFSNSQDSRILILEDTDQDGTADLRKVFLEGIPFPSAITVGFDGVWLGAPPNLLFVPDRNRDDRADFEQIEVRLTGWGIADRHETLNSLHWGPDGWLYGCQGFATPSRVGKPADRKTFATGNHPFPQKIAYDGGTVDFNGGVWRYHPTKDRFEVVAHGFSNPWGIDYDAHGELFITACVIPHLWHVIPGGIYHRQGGQHFNPFHYSDIRTIADHRHRSAHGGARVYLSDAFPPRYQGQLFMANIHEHAVLVDSLEPSGSGFVGHHGEDFLLANNAQWIGFSVEIGPDGSVYVLDWHDADICGNEVVHKETGRVYRISPIHSRAQAWQGRYTDLNLHTDEQLAALQLSSSNWHARRARVILQGRAVTGELSAAAESDLRRTYSSHHDVSRRLCAMWALHITGLLPADDLLAALDDKDAYVRSWAIQLLCEDRDPPPRALPRFVELAVRDPSPVVRRYLAAALQRMAPDDRWPIAEALVGHREDNRDHNIPKMIWFGIEPLVPAAPNRAMQLAIASRIDMIARHIARRLVDADQLEPLAAALPAAAANRVPLLSGMRDGLNGRSEVQPPPSWNAAARQLRQSGGKEAELALLIDQEFGDTSAAAQMLTQLQDVQTPLERRREAIQALSRRRDVRLKPLLLPLLAEQALRRDAIQAIAAFDDQRLARDLLSHYSKLSVEEKLDAIHTLAARQSSGRLLTEAISRGNVPKRDVPAYVARLMRRVVGNRFADVWGPVDQLSADLEANFRKYRQLLTTASLASGDSKRGREVFLRTCQTCHKLHGEGGEIGPDITGANRANLEYLLGNILTPSAVIQDAYKMQLVVTLDGRVFNGILAGENDHQLQLRVAGREQPVAISKSTIDSREIASVSMMPAGLLTNLTDAEVVDLISYLQQ